jgi:hypothetical protein
MGDMLQFGRRKDDFKDLEPLHPRLEIMIAQMEQLIREKEREHRTERWMRSMMAYTFFSIHVTGVITLLWFMIGHPLLVILAKFFPNLFSP